MNLNEIVQAVVLAVAVGLQCWSMKQVIELLKDNAAIKQQQRTHDDTIREIQLHGSPVVQRVDAKLELLSKGQDEIKRAISEKFNVKIL
jgi:Mg2+ and Co2+ transporter CorA